LNQITANSRMLKLLVPAMSQFHSSCVCFKQFRTNQCPSVQMQPVWDIMLNCTCLELDWDKW